MSDANVATFERAGLNHSLLKLMSINHAAQEKAKHLPEMMRFNIYALKTKYELH